VQCYDIHSYMLCIKWRKSIKQWICTPSSLPLTNCLVFYVFMHAYQIVLRTVFSFHSLICLHRTVTVKFIKLVEFFHCVKRIEAFCCWHHWNLLCCWARFTHDVERRRANFTNYKNSTDMTSRNATLSPAPVTLCHTPSDPLPPLQAWYIFWMAPCGHCLIRLC